MLTDLFVVLLAAKLGDEVFKRIHQPAIVGEILGGVLVGPSVLGLVEVGEVLRVFSELGVVFLLFWVGLETRLSEMRAVGRMAVTVGSAGVVLPFLAGIGLGLALGESTETSVFLGAALAATSAGITSATFLDLGIARSRAARTVLGAAVVDDILALILLSVAVGMAADGGVDGGKIALALAVAVAFVAFVALGGTGLLQRRPKLLQAPRFADSPLLPAVILCLGLAAFAAQIGLAALIGAFLAGMIVAETKDQSSIEEEVRPLYAFFPPFFFAFIGIELEPRLAAARRRPNAAGRGNRAGGRDQADPRLPRRPRAGARAGLDRRRRHGAARRGRDRRRLDRRRRGRRRRGAVRRRGRHVDPHHAGGAIRARTARRIAARFLGYARGAKGTATRRQRGSAVQQVSLDQQLGDLDGVGGGALAEVVGDDPEVEGALVAGSRRMRPTRTSSLPAASIAIG